MNEDNPDCMGFGFCPVLAELVNSRSAIGKTGKKFHGLAALSSCNNLLTLRKLMLETNPEKTLEIGFGFGGSALVFSASHRDLKHSPQRQHIVLDPLQESVWDSSGLLATERAGLSQYLDFRQRFSAVELPNIIEQGDRFGLVYIDGSHLFEDVFVDAYFVIRLLSKGGIVAFDDSAKTPVAKVLRFIRTNLSGSVSEIDLGPYRPQHENRFVYRVAHRIGKVQLTAFRRTGSAERDWNAPFHRF